MLTATFYMSSAETNRVDKSAAIAADKSPITLSVVMKYPTDILAPTLDIDYDDSTALFTKNYVYIADLKRFYYIVTWSTVTNGVYTCACHVDVLMSHKDKFLSLPAFIDRNEFEPLSLLPDDNWAFSDDIETSVLSTTLGVSSSQAALVVVCSNPPPTYKQYNVPETETLHKQCLLKFRNAAYNSNKYGYTIWILYGDYTCSDWFKTIANSEQYRSYVISQYLLGAFVSPTSTTDPTEAAYYSAFTEMPVENGNSKITLTSYEFGEVGSRIKTVDISVDVVGGSVRGKVYRGDNPVFTFQDFIKLEIPYAGTFLALSPFAQYRVFVPFYGYFDLDSQIMAQANGKELWFSFLVDLSNGTFSCDIFIPDFYINGADKEAYHFDVINGSLGMPIPVTGNNLDSVMRQEQSIALRERNAIANNEMQLANGVMGGLLQMFGGGAQTQLNLSSAKPTLSPAGALGAMTNAIGGGINAIMSAVNYGVQDSIIKREFDAQRISNIPFGSAQSANSNFLRCSNVTTIRLEIYNRKSLIDKSEIEVPTVEGKGYRHLVGIPVKKIKNLNTIHGFTAISDMHLPISCLNAEKVELKQLMLSGIILP